MPDFQTMQTLARSMAHSMGVVLEDGPPEPSHDGPEMPPEPDEDIPEEPPQEAQEARVLVPDEVLDPEALIPTALIVAKLEGITAADVAKSVMLAERAIRVGLITTDAQQTDLDELRDALKAHQADIEARLTPYCDVAYKLHKALTGLRASALGRVPDAVKHAGNVLAVYMRQKAEAEAARQRAERAKALAEERARLKAEADAAELERQRLAVEAEQARQVGDEDTAQALLAQADIEATTAAQARQEAIYATAPAVAAQDIMKPDGASAADAWQALPAHAEDRDDMPLADKTALIIFVGERLSANDGSFIHLLSVDWKAAKALAKAQKSTMRVPGLRAVNPPTYRKTTRG